MKPQPAIVEQPPVKPAPAQPRIPQWEQFPARNRQELTEILAEMLIKQVQQGVAQERAS